MSIFKVHSKMCPGLELDASFTKFWRSSMEDKRKTLALKYCDSFCQPKSCEELGFHKFRDLNTTLLSKLAWMLISSSLKIVCEGFIVDYPKLLCYNNSRLTLY